MYTYWRGLPLKSKTTLKLVTVKTEVFLFSNFQRMFFILSLLFSLTHLQALCTCLWKSVFPKNVTDVFVLRSRHFPNWVVLPFKFNVKSIRGNCILALWNHFNTTITEMSLLYFSVPRWWFSKIEMKSLKLRTAKIRHFPCALKIIKVQIIPGKACLKALQTVSEALYIQMSLWCHPYATLLIAIL